MAAVENICGDHGSSFHGQSSCCGWGKKMSPTLSLLSTPWEYFVTIDQSALWQKHIAWAKPRGSDLKAYVSLQYSSRMVLLSLLLATEMSVFFNSSPVLIHLRRRLNVWDNDVNSSESENDVAKGFLPFWIGFFLLLNICVTISSILATFSTWNVVSAISDSNAHCLLRSSLGQYVATLSPRLVVASLYLFFLWFLLFVVELLFGSAIGSSRNDSRRWWELLHELLTKHLHLVLLWALFLVGVTALFFSIVVPLSAFGRLVLHTGAMAEPPVLSESLQVELLPRGLHAGLVIRAHHSQRKMTAVTRQYTQRKRDLRRQHFEDERKQEDRFIATGEAQPSSNISVSSASSDGNHNNDNLMVGIVKKSTTQNNDGKVGDGKMSTCSADVIKAPNSYSSLQHQPSIFDSDLTQDRRIQIDPNCNRIPKCNAMDCSNIKEKRFDTTSASTSHHRRHRRISTIESVASLCLPPATILNLAMTARELHDVIDNAIDTNSQETTARSPMNRNETMEWRSAESESDNYECMQYDENNGYFINNNNYSAVSVATNNFEPRENQQIPSASIEEGCSRIGTDRGGDSDISKENQLKSPVLESRKRFHSRTTIGVYRGGIPLSPHFMSTPTARSVASGGAAIADAKTTQQKPRRRNSRNEGNQDIITRHHRRVSSSRFLLEEWAQENRVRDLYGAAPPADLPQEIAWMLDDKYPNNSANTADSQCKFHESEAYGTSANNSPTNNSNIYSTEASPSLWNRSQNLLKQEKKQGQESQQQHWWFSPFSSPFGDRNRISDKNSVGSIHPSQQHRNDETVVTQTPLISYLYNGKHTEDAKKPLLPDLTSSRDEELGRESSELFGERLLLSDIDKK